MADTLAAIESQLRVELPMPQYDNIGGEDVLMSQSRYGQWISDQALEIREQQLEQEALASWDTMIQQFVSGRSVLQSDLITVNTRINNNTALTAAEIRIGFRDLLQSMIWLSDRISDGTIVIRKP